MKFINKGKVIAEIKEEGVIHIGTKAPEHKLTVLDLSHIPNPKDAYEYLTEGQFLPHKSAMIIIRGMFTEEAVDKWMRETTEDGGW